MNKKLTLAAIAMFAVIVGMSALAPAMAAKQGKILMCHYDAITYDEFGTPISGTDDWIVISINQNAESAHAGIHTDGESYDFVVNDDDGDDTNDSQDCTDRNL